MENEHKIIYGKIASGVKGFVKSLIKGLLSAQVTELVVADRDEGSTGPIKAIEMLTLKSKHILHFKDDQ